MGRPKKINSELKSKKVTIRFTEEELAYLKTFGDNFSDVIRDVFIKNFKKKNVIIDTNKDPRFIHELNKIGINLNQISKKYNATGELSSLDIEKLNSLVEYLCTIIYYEVNAKI